MTGLVFALFVFACLVAGFCWFAYWEERRNKRLLSEYNDNPQKYAEGMNHTHVLARKKGRNRK